MTVLPGQRTRDLFIFVSPEPNRAPWTWLVMCKFTDWAVSVFFCLFCFIFSGLFSAMIFIMSLCDGSSLSTFSLSSHGREDLGHIFLPLSGTIQGLSLPVIDHEMVQVLSSALI